MYCLPTTNPKNLKQISDSDMRDSFSNSEDFLEFSSLQIKTHTKERKTGKEQKKKKL